MTPRVCRRCGAVWDAQAQAWRGGKVFAASLHLTRPAHDGPLCDTCRRWFRRGRH